MSLEEHQQPHPGGGSGAHRRHLLKHQIRLRKRQTPEGKERFEIVPIQDTLSFEKGFFLFVRAVQTLVQENDGVILVGLAGPSGAGKTEFSKKVVSFLPGVSLISMDNYNVGSRVIDGNFDDPRITDYDLLLENIASLRRGEPAEVPIYDFKTSSRVGFHTVPVPQSRIIIVEGIYALSERLRPNLDLRVSIAGGVHFDLVKRVLRDIDRSGQPPEEIIAQISETVYPMYKAFIEPDLATAHIKIVNKFNPFSGFQDATYILKSPADGIDESAVRGVLSEDVAANTEETYDIYLLPPGEDKETCVSYLRMRNRDGRYSLMFEEWVTDGPFVITPRITFEVSVRLLGGLMALGYELAHVIRRESRVFKDPNSKVTVKLDHLEQLGKDYAQVQGKDRVKVKEVAEKLGMEGKFIAKPYIEQIMLDNLTKEIQAPRNPKAVLERFRLPEDWLTVGQGGQTLITPRQSLAASWSESGKFIRKSTSHDLDTTALSPSSSAGDIDLQLPSRGPSGRSHLGRGATGSGELSRNGTGAGSTRGGNNSIEVIAAQGIMERLEELLTRMDNIETKIASSNGTPRVATPPTAAIPTPGSASALSSQLAPPGISNGLAAEGHLANGLPPANGSIHASPVTMSTGIASMGALPAGAVPMELLRGAVRGSFELPRGTSTTSVVEFLEEVRILARNQSRMADELEALNGMLRQTLGSGPGRGPTPAWRLETIMTASAVVSLACASALIFSLFKSRT